MSSKTPAPAPIIDVEATQSQTETKTETKKTTWGAIIVIVFILWFFVAGNSSHATQSCDITAYIDKPQLEAVQAQKACINSSNESYKKVVVKEINLLEAKEQVAISNKEAVKIGNKFSLNIKE